ncbi:alpha/beta hydrolase [Actinocorallia sp. API 0066]|uniref:alpha/beta fold hydrolase n=1 Tax=Actinocorallia sp. API 0066 TaxID=2896846 RepID=UPI001E3C4C7C|nr:alpha/beta hydrolase [Actinocorallia sp. API 0066]MCD0452035.1 alpha/beta hydrolase [Actinocorallia sp. API 0066]
MKELFWTDTGTTTGTGRPLVLLHGGFLDHTQWDDQVPLFSARHRVIAPDARGHGRSENATAPFRHVDDLAALLRHLKTGPAVLVGVSMGASTAVDLALEYPDLVAALVVSGAGTSEPYFTDPWTLGVWGEWTAAMSRGDLDGSVAAFLRFAAGPHRALDDVDPGVVRRLRAMATRTMSKHTADEGDPLVPVTDTWARAAGITVPLLSVRGALDSPDHLGMADRLVQTVQIGRSATLDGAAHYPDLERPEGFHGLVSGFLDGL